jgi:hypothetical protein
MYYPYKIQYTVMEGSGILIYSGELHVSQELVHPAPRGQNSTQKVLIETNKIKQKG